MIVERRGRRAGHLGIRASLLPHPNRAELSNALDVDNNRIYFKIYVYGAEKERIRVVTILYPEGCGKLFQTNDVRKVGVCTGWFIPFP